MICVRCQESEDEIGGFSRTATRFSTGDRGAATPLTRQVVQQIHLAILFQPKHLIHVRTGNRVFGVEKWHG